MFLVYNPLHVEFCLSETNTARELVQGIIKKKQRGIIFQKDKKGRLNTWTSQLTIKLQSFA